MLDELFVSFYNKVQQILRYYAQSQTELQASLKSVQSIKCYALLD